MGLVTALRSHVFRKTINLVQDMESVIVGNVLVNLVGLDLIVDAAHSHVLMVALDMEHVNVEFAIVTLIGLALTAPFQLAQRTTLV